MSDCVKCYGSGYVTENNQFVAFCSCQKGQEVRKLIWEQKLSEAGILREYWDLKFSDLIPQPAYTTHVQFIRDIETYLKHIKEHKNDGEIWLIYGAMGVGKTFAASLIAKEALKKDYSVIYYRWSDLVDKTFSDAHLIDRLRDVDFLIMDDLGCDKVSSSSTSKFAEDLLEKIIKPRFSNKRPTILVSPRAYEDLVARFPVLLGMIPTQNYSKVDGMNYRVNKRTK